MDRASGSTLDVAYDYNATTAGKCDTNCHGSQADTWLWDYNSTIPVNAYSKAVACGACHSGGVTNTATSQSHAGHGRSSGTIVADETICEQCHPTMDYTQYTGTHNDTNVDVDGTKVDYAGGTCETANCHNNPDNGGDRSTQWDVATALACDDCHYYDVSGAAVSSGNNSSHKASLSTTHGAHFDKNKWCTDCHGAIPSDTAHISNYASLADAAVAIQDEATVSGNFSWVDTTAMSAMLSRSLRSEARDAFAISRFTALGSNTPTSATSLGSTTSFTQEA